MNGWVNHFNFTDCCWRERDVLPQRRKRSILQDSDSIPNSAGCCWHDFCRKHKSEHHHRCPGQRALLLGTHKVGKSWKADVSLGTAKGWENIGVLGNDIAASAFGGFSWVFPPLFLYFTKCNYANEGALIIIHLQQPWLLLGARGSRICWQEGTGGHCTPGGTCALGCLDEQKSLGLNCSEMKAPSPH